MRVSRRMPFAQALLTFILCIACIGEAVFASEPEPVPSVEPAWRATVRSFAAEHFKNPAWGYSHAVRDYMLGRQLAARDKVSLDDDVMFAAAYLHDMAAFPPWEKQGIDHSDGAVEIVNTILEKTGFPMDKLEAVRGAILTHMYDRNPVGPEALYLHDADALDWLGAIGVVRIIALVDPKGGTPTAPQLIPMIEDNLAKVPGRVLSAAGRTIAVERKSEMERFLQELRRETDDLRSL